MGRVGLNPANDGGRYAAGTLVRATASCYTGFQFEGWREGVPAGADPSSPSIIVVVDRERNLVASCAEPPPPSSPRLTINGEALEPGQLTLLVPNGTITLNQSPGSAGKFEAGARVVLLATPRQPDFQVTWSGVDSVDGNFGRLEMREDREVEVTIERPVFTLTAGANPQNAGSVAGGGRYLSGTQATLRATPSSGWQFVDSSGTCSVAASCIVVMDSHKSVIANFQPVSTPGQYTLVATASPANGGTVSPSGVNTYTEGTTVTVTASAASGYTFSGWSGACSGTGVCSVTMDSYKSVTASFQAPVTPTYTLATSASPPGGGTLTPAGTNSYDEGASVTVTATAAGQYAFSYWSGACSGTGTCTVTMESSKSVTANFEGDTPVAQYTLTTTASPSDGGTVSPSGASSYNEGTSVTVTATANSGYSFSGWSGDCTGAGDCTVAMTGGDKAVTAQFVQTFALIVNGSQVTGATHDVTNGSVSESPAPDAADNRYTSGTSVTLTATAGSGYTFSSWSGDCSGTGTCPLTMDSNKSVTATFTPTQSVGGRIAFYSNRDGQREIYVMDADGANQTRITFSGGNSSPHWSPDGSKIAFEAERDGHSEVYVMNADGSNQVRLTNNAGQNWPGSWSPDGTKIAFHSSRDGNYEVYVMNSDGSNQTRITNQSGVDQKASWSSDGDKFAFTTTRDGYPEIYVMNADGSNPVNLSNNTAEDDKPDWSPDRSKIVFESLRDGNSEIYVMNADGTNQTRLTTHAGHDGAPSWSPQETWGTKIVFHSDRDGDAEIYVMDSDGSNQTRLTNNSAADNGPDWEP